MLSCKHDCWVVSHNQFLQSRHTSDTQAAAAGIYWLCLVSHVNDSSSSVTRTSPELLKVGLAGAFLAAAAAPSSSSRSSTPNSAKKSSSSSSTAAAKTTRHARLVGTSTAAGMPDFACRKHYAHGCCTGCPTVTAAAVCSWLCLQDTPASTAMCLVMQYCTLQQYPAGPWQL